LCGFLVQFLSGLLAVKEPAGCVHACSKWQTSEGAQVALRPLEC
jgi:hypothetical protein